MSFYQLLTAFLLVFTHLTGTHAATLKSLGNEADIHFVSQSEVVVKIPKAAQRLRCSIDLDEVSLSIELGEIKISAHETIAAVSMRDLGFLNFNSSSEARASDHFHYGNIPSWDIGQLGRDTNCNRAKEKWRKLISKNGWLELKGQRSTHLRISALEKQIQIVERVVSEISGITDFRDQPVHLDLQQMWQLGPYDQLQIGALNQVNGQGANTFAVYPLANLEDHILCEQGPSDNHNSQQILSIKMYYSHYYPLLINGLKEFKSLKHFTGATANSDCELLRQKIISWFHQESFRNNTLNLPVAETVSSEIDGGQKNYFNIRQMISIDGIEFENRSRLHLD